MLFLLFGISKSTERLCEHERLLTSVTSAHLLNICFEIVLLTHSYLCDGTYSFLRVTVSEEKALSLDAFMRTVRRRRTRWSKLCGAPVRVSHVYVPLASRRRPTPSKDKNTRAGLERPKAVSDSALLRSRRQLEYEGSLLEEVSTSLKGARARLTS